jgi:hypothetical protein
MNKTPRKTRDQGELKKFAAFVHLVTNESKYPRDAISILTDADFSDDVTEFGWNRNYSFRIALESVAQTEVRNYIQESLWAFNSAFLADFTDLPTEVFEAIQKNDKCEGNNNCLLRLVEKSGGLAELVQKAIQADGIGHFLNSYDGKADKITLGGETFVVWKQ